MQLVVNGLLVSYQDIHPKAKNTIIILHGWLQNSNLWLTLTNSLPQTNRYIILDLPGFGASSPLNCSNPGTHQYSQFLHYFISKLKLKRVSLIGHSFGGQIAIDYALHYSKTLKQLILISPACIRKSSAKTNIIKKIKTFLPTLPPIFNHLLQSSNYSQSNPYQKKVMSKIIAEDYSQKLNKISTQTHVIWGSEDKEIPYMGKYICQKIPTSHLHILYGSGHSPHLEPNTHLTEVLNQILC